MTAANMIKPNLRPGQHRNNRGFTMIELMITITVFAILAAVGLPSFKSFIAAQRIKSASFDIMSSMMLARSEAVKRNANADVTPTSGSWMNGWTVSTGGTTLEKHAALKTGVAVTCYSGTSAVTPCPTVTYTYSGRISGTAPSIQFSNSGSSSVILRCISMDLSGRPNSKTTSCP